MEDCRSFARGSIPLRGANLERFIVDRKQVIALIDEAKIQSEKHPSKDARFFAKSMIKPLQLLNQLLMSEEIKRIELVRNMLKVRNKENKYTDEELLEFFKYVDRYSD